MQRFRDLRNAMLRNSQSVAESVASSAAKTAHDLKAVLIIVATETGNTARLVAKYCPNVRGSAVAAARGCGMSDCADTPHLFSTARGSPQIPILALTATDYVARQCAGVLKGVHARLVRGSRAVETL